MTIFDIYKSPGHLVRRAQQIVVSLFIEHTGDAITPIQYGVLAVLEASGDLDQITLAQRMALDASTSGNVLERMQKRGWIHRQVDPTDRRRRIVSLTESGRNVLEELLDDVVAVQHTLLEPLDPKERAVFMRLLSKMVEANNERSRAPLKTGS